MGYEEKHGISKSASSMADRIIREYSNFDKALYSEWNEIRDRVSELPTAVLAAIVLKKPKNITYIATKELLNRPISS
jgi:hypothetical protein